MMTGRVGEIISKNTKTNNDKRYGLRYRITINHQHSYFFWRLGI